MHDRNKTLLILLALAGIMHANCEVFNDSCPVTTPEVWGQINVDLDIRRDYVRRCEAPVGNFLADALLNFEYDLQDPDTDPPGRDINVRVALFNAGAIRDEVRCGAEPETRERIPKGAVTDQDIYQLMPFYQDVVVVKMKGGQLLKVLERGVSSLTLEGKLSAEGHFLQVAGELNVRVDVDCSGDAQTLDAEAKNIEGAGSRIKLVQIGESSIIDPGDPTTLDGIFYVATLDYLVGTDDNGVPNDGFVAFQEAGVVVFETHRPVIDIVRWWLEGYPVEKDYPGVDPRLNFQSCAHTSQYCEAVGD